MDQRAASLAQLTDDLEVASRRLVEATRRLSAAGWRRRTTSGSVADVVQALVTALAELEHAVDVGPAPPPAAWRSPSKAPYAGALPDRLAVVVAGLVAALRAAPEDWRVWYDGSLVPVTTLAAAALQQMTATVAR